MALLHFLLGLACGLALAFLGSSLKARRAARAKVLSEDEKLLLNAARAMGGRLLLKEERAASGQTLLRLLEVPGQKGIEPKGQVDRLLNRGLIVKDPSGLPGRFQLSPQGWSYVENLPPLPVDKKRARNWFDSAHHDVPPEARKGRSRT